MLCNLASTNGVEYFFLMEGLSKSSSESSSLSPLPGGLFIPRSCARPSPILMTLASQEHVSIACWSTSVAAKCPSALSLTALSAGSTPICSPSCKIFVRCRVTMGPCHVGMTSTCLASEKWGGQGGRGCRVNPCSCPYWMRQSEHRWRALAILAPPVLRAMVYSC